VSYCGQRPLNEGEIRPLTLYAGFHEETDFCLVDELDALRRKYCNFAWHFTVTNPSRPWCGMKGRITECIPPLLRTTMLEKHHFHLVGNGEMVHLVRKALYRAGMPAQRVSIETYFNHHADPADVEIEALAARFRDGSGS
jgi:NAD(P)H-flavin reductase